MRGKKSLFLILIILAVFPQPVLAIDEVVDNYTDETKVASKHLIVRNATFGAMELEITLQGDSENFTTYTEVDGGGDITITQDRITFTTMRRGEDDYVYKDFGVDYFGDFTHNFTVSINDLEAGDASSTTIASIWGVTNTVGTQDEFEHGDVITLMLVEDGSTDDRYRYLLFQYDGGVITGLLEYSGFYNLATHYITIIKNGTRVDAYIYSDADRLNLLESIGNNGVDNSHRYLQPLTSCGKDDDPNDHVTGHVEYYFLGPLVLSYENNGHFYTTDLLSGISYNATALLLNTTIPDDDYITIEISQDNSNWILNDWEPIFGGYEAVDLRTLNYKTLYLRFNFTDGGVDSTPRLYQLRLIHEAPCVNITCKSFIFNASSITVIVGTLNDGNLASTFSVDGDWYNVSEINDSPGIDVRVNFTGVCEDAVCGCLDVYHTYTGHSQHEIAIEFYNFNSSTWVPRGAFLYNETAGWACVGLGDDPDSLVNNGTLWARFYHADRGHLNHELHIDSIKLNVACGEACPPCGALVAMAKFYALAISLLILGLLIGIGIRRKR